MISYVFDNDTRIRYSCIIVVLGRTPHTSIQPVWKQNPSGRKYYSRKRCNEKEFPEAMQREKILGSGATRMYSRKLCNEKEFPEAVRRESILGSGFLSIWPVDHEAKAFAVALSSVEKKEKWFLFQSKMVNISIIKYHRTYI